MRINGLHLKVYLLLTLFCACNKDWLEAKPDNSLIVPSTISEIQALLDNDQVFNVQQPALGLMGSDDYFLPVSSLSSLQNIERNAYQWESDVFEGTSVSDWDVTYQAVNYANLAIEKLNSIQLTESNSADWNILYGSALYYRAYAFFTLLELFSKQYDPTTATSDLGIPLRLTSDINEPAPRASNEQCYNQIVNDLKIAVQGLPQRSMKATRPSKAACYGLLARVMLNMKRYDEALLFADSTLLVQNNLLDYNSISTDLTNSFPFPSNDEVIYYTWLLGYGGISFYAYVDSTLYNSFHESDLRKRIFFRYDGTGYAFKGSYSGLFLLFGGIAVDEIYLIKAEGHARKGQISEAMGALNYLLEKRWVSGTFTPLTAGTQEEAINNILNERRKELVFRGTRWSDLRRLNSEGSNIVITREVNSENFTLLPNDIRYVYPIPDNEIRLSGIQQNPR